MADNAKPQTPDEILSYLKAKVKENHDRSLVYPNASPNGNVQTLFWPDGEITSTKGGWAFMERSQFSVIRALSIDNVFEMEDQDGKTIKYAIVKNLEVAREMRELLKSYIESFPLKLQGK
jgi:hypothetical protein